MRPGSKNRSDNEVNFRVSPLIPMSRSLMRKRPATPQENRLHNYKTPTTMHLSSRLRSSLLLMRLTISLHRQCNQLKLNFHLHKRKQISQRSRLELESRKTDLIRIQKSRAAFFPGEMKNILSQINVNCNKKLCKMPCVSRLKKKTAKKKLKRHR